MKLNNKRIFEIYESNKHLTREQKAELCNEEFGTNFTESAFRKRYATYKDGLNSNFELSDQFELLVKRELNIKTEQKKLVISRSIINKQITKNAFVDLVQETISDIDFPVYKFDRLKVKKSNDEWWLLSHADLHYDGNFSLKEHFTKLYNIVLDRGMKELYIFGLGDEIEGLLRVSAAMDSKLGAVAQMREYAVEYLNFLQQLSCHVKLHVYQVSSANHSETRVLGTNRGEMEEDLLDFLTAIIETGTKNNPNIDFVYDREIHTNINGFMFYLEHGHKMKKATSYIEKKISNKNIVIDYFYAGHIHHYVNETLHARDGYDFDYTAVPSCKPDISRYEDGLNLSSNSSILLEKFDSKGRVTTEKIILTHWR